jgi:soluble P-type ATPase
MIRISVPGLGEYKIQHLVLDVNGTIALDGKLLPGVSERLGRINHSVELHLVTADSHGNQAAIDTALGTTAVRITPGHESDQKGRYVRTLGAANVVAIGNGENDVGMLISAAIGIAVLGEEGLASRAYQAADVISRSIGDALDLVLHPARLSATLRR